MTGTEELFLLFSLPECTLRLVCPATMDAQEADSAARRRSENGRVLVWCEVAAVDLSDLSTFNRIPAN